VHLHHCIDRTAGRCGKIQRATPERRGQSIGGYDTLIAGHARSRELIIVTRNMREFDRVEGLRTEVWLADPPAC